MNAVWLLEILLRQRRVLLAPPIYAAAAYIGPNFTPLNHLLLAPAGALFYLWHELFTLWYAIIYDPHHQLYEFSFGPLMYLTSEESL